MMNTYIAKMMNVMITKMKNECVKNEHMNECTKSIYNKYEDKCDIYIIEIKIEFKKLNT